MIKKPKKLLTDQNKMKKKDLHLNENRHIGVKHVGDQADTSISFQWV